MSCDTVQSLGCTGCQLVTADEDESHLEGIGFSSQAQPERYYELITLVHLAANRGQRLIKNGYCGGCLLTIKDEWRG